MTDAEDRIIATLRETRQEALAVVERCERAIAAIIGEAPESTPPKPQPRPRVARATAKRNGHASTNGDALDAIRSGIVTFAADHEEFRQVDIRNALGGRLASSSLMAGAFDTLTKEGFIRFSRRAGTSKLFALTETAP